MSMSSQEKLKCPIKSNSDQPNGRVDPGKVVSYWSQVIFLKQIGMSGHKARRIAYQRAFENDDAASQNILTEE